ncbi:hypothetical protein QMZ64_21465 [Bacillus sp. LB7]|uniref:hypothetical protein n=1 Tax=Bacillus TaxID=1386 RepID=UPI00264898CD|nr:hypothetical protein [Bacillus sp. LB7]MDN5389962.1 hypothetical protein [Bacillus sp. LB7]
MGEDIANLFPDSVKEAITTLSNKDKFYRFALEAYAQRLFENWGNEDKKKIIQNCFQFEAEDQFFKDMLKGSEINPEKGLEVVKAAVFDAGKVYISTNVNGQKEFALAGEAYDKNGRIITENFNNHYIEKDIYFNGDEGFFEQQKNNLILKDSEEHIKKYHNIKDKTKSKRHDQSINERLQSFER